MPLPFSELRVAVPDRVITRAVEGTMVLLDIDTGRSFTLDETGVRAWTLLTSSPSVERAYDALLAEYQVDPKQLRQDLETLINDLCAKDLLETHRA